MEALVDGDADRASSLTGVGLGDFLASEDCSWLWRIRLAQATKDPTCLDWVARAAVAEPDGPVVGHAGFHGPPDASGMVEVGYTVDPAYRRRGYARAMVRALLAWAAAAEGVTRVRASISPDNTASLATIRGFGFERVGEQWDEEDGLEILLEVPV
jgi:[ribosomal protein S5]-alanine N-acetyltransferase